MTGPQMYEAVCGSCHGVNGDGNGSATRSLWPPPRNFRRDRFRLVSTENLVPSLSDIEYVIRNGMPGTSMQANTELDDAQVRLLAEEVQRHWHDGVREQLQEAAQEDGSQLEEDTLQADVRSATTPGRRVPAPEFDRIDSQAVARGEAIYFKQGCASCHGQDGVGAWDIQLRDDEGQPTRPRDLVHEPFKGGRFPESIYLRLKLGMPGTPHPASPGLSEDELVDLVHFCRSLGRSPTLNLTGRQRRDWATSQSYLRARGRRRPD